MEIKHANYGYPNEMQTMQIMRTTCPLCHEAVQFAIHEDDRQYKDDAEYYEEQAIRWRKEVQRLNKLIDVILQRGRATDRGRRE